MRDAAVGNPGVRASTCAALAAHLAGGVYADLLSDEGAGDGLDGLNADALAQLLEQELSAANVQLAETL